MPHIVVAVAVAVQRRSVTQCVRERTSARGCRAFSGPNMHARVYHGKCVCVCMVNNCVQRGVNDGDDCYDVLAAAVAHCNGSASAAVRGFECCDRELGAYVFTWPFFVCVVQFGRNANTFTAVS